MRIAFDDNLGLPVDFADHSKCRLTAFHDLDSMVAALDCRDVDAMFAPAGSLPYVTPGTYVVAQATLGPAQELSLRSMLCVSASSDLGLSDVAFGPIGFINRHCTTSYWGPMITLLDLVPAGTVLDFRVVDGFGDLLSSIGDHRVDSAMVWDVILDENPEDAERVQQLARYAMLPSPLIYVGADVKSADREDLRARLTDWTSIDSQSRFSGFARPDYDGLARFMSDTETAALHFASSTRSG